MGKLKESYWRDAVAEYAKRLSCFCRFEVIELAEKRTLEEEAVRLPETREFISLFDVLVDGRFVEELKDIRLKFRGSSNQRVIDVPKSLQTGKVVLYLP